MLELVYGTDWVANRNMILHKISADVAHKRPGSVLLVPELISHDMERRLCAAAGDTASRYAEVLSFTRLARRIADSVGSAAAQCMDDGGRVVAMAAAVRSLHNVIKAYADVETKPEFLTALVDMVDEFKRGCIKPADLEAAAEKTEGSLKEKLLELALLLQTYESVCAQGLRDPGDQMNWLIGELQENEFPREHVFYIDGFPDFSRQHMQIIQILLEKSNHVIVSLTCDDIPSEHPAFETAGETARELIAMAKQLQLSVKYTHVQPEDPGMQAVAAQLFHGAKVHHPVNAERIHVYRTASEYDECMAAAEHIMQLVRSGSRYRDISIVCADVGAYRNVIQMVFRRCGIPIYVAGTDDILEKSVISAVLSALDAALNDFEQKSMLRYLKSVLSPLLMDECDRLENYAILWGIGGKHWLQDWSSHPDGLNGLWTKDSEAELELLNAMRRRVTEPLEQLRSGLLSAKTVADQIRAVYNFFENIQLSQRLKQLAQDLDMQGDNRTAQIINQLWEIMLNALEQMHDVLGNMHWNHEYFVRLFTLLLGQYDVGTIPTVLDAVMIGPVSAMRCQEVRHLFVLGALEGNLPGYGKPKEVLSDQERGILRVAGIPLADAMDGLQSELAEIYGVFCGARESVYVSCPDGQPSYIYRRLCDMARGEEAAPVILGAAQVDLKEAGAYLARWGAADEAAMLGAQDAYRDTVSRHSYHLGCIGRENVHGLYGKKLSLSASQVDRQAECRLSYFLKYGLRAKERKEATVDPAEFGTYVHAVLEKTSRRVMELGGFHQVSLEQTLEIAHEYSGEYAREHFAGLDSERHSYLFRRNNQELDMVLEELWKELKDAAFEPVDFETAFGDGGDLPAIQTPGTHMDAQLRGFVDRVDTWRENGQNFFRVVDYKTGKKDFDYCDVFNGIGLQMLLYLFALEQGGEAVVGKHPVPAGVQYFPARAPLVSSEGRMTEEEAQKARQKEWKRKGLLLADDQVLYAMEPDDTMSRLSCTRKKDGSLSGDVADREQFRLLRAYLFRVLGKLVDEIASGDVSPNPYTRGTSHSACTFCPYSAVCQKESAQGRRNYKAMTASRFWEEIRKEMEHHGGKTDL